MPITPENNPQTQSPPSSFTKKTIGQPGPAPLVASSGAVHSPAGFYRENRFYVWAILAGVVTISVLAYFAFRKSPPVAPTAANVTISVDVPETAPAGGQTVYKIKVENDDTQKLVQMSLELAYGEGMSFISSVPNPQNLSGTQFAVPDLSPGQNAVITVKAQLSGNVNDQKNLSMKVHYRFSNFNSEFLAQEISTVRLTASNVALDISGPTTTNNAQIAVYTVRYQNNSNDAISGAQIKLNYPSGFVFATAQPPSDSAGNIWNIDALASGASGTITIQGSFNSSNPGEGKTISADFLILGQDGQYFTQNSRSFTTTMASLPLLVSQVVDNLNAESTVNPGENLRYSIKYQNNSSVVATGVNVLLTLNSKALDFSSIQAEGAQVNNNTISWDASSVSNLGSLNPNESGQLSFSVRVKNPATKDSSKNLTVLSDIKIKSTEYDSYFPGNQVSLKISSPVSLNTALDFQSGQLPPQVGKTSLYSVTLTLTNSTNDFNGGTLTAFIPLGAGGFVPGSVNSAESGKVQFDSTTSKLTWQVGSLPAHIGQFSPARTLQFGVRLIPSASQAGERPTLIKDIQFNATDSFTGQPVSAKADNITTGDLSGNNGQNSTVER